VKKARTVFALLLVLVSGWLAYDNVLSDEAPILTLAEQAACTVKKCEEKHGMTRLSRHPFGQSMDYTWRDGVVSVGCRRAFIVAGERRCVAEGTP
jgi:hypothetical protein